MNSARANAKVTPVDSPQAFEGSCVLFTKLFVRKHLLFIIVATQRPVCGMRAFDAPTMRPSEAAAIWGTQ